MSCGLRQRIELFCRGTRPLARQLLESSASFNRAAMCARKREPPLVAPASSARPSPPLASGRHGALDSWLYTREQRSHLSKDADSCGLELLGSWRPRLQAIVRDAHAQLTNSFQDPCRDVPNSRWPQ
jgi:hypothetical protein